MDNLIDSKHWANTFDFILGVSCPVFGCIGASILSLRDLQQMGKLLRTVKGFGYLGMLINDLQMRLSTPPYNATQTALFCDSYPAKTFFQLSPWNNQTVLASLPLEPVTIAPNNQGFLLKKKTWSPEKGGKP